MIDMIHKLPETQIGEAIKGQARITAFFED